MTRPLIKQDASWIAERLRANREALAALRAHVEQCGGNRWGVFMHFLTEAATTADEWDRQVEGLKVEALAAQLAEVGAGYFLITLGQGSGPGRRNPGSTPSATSTGCSRAQHPSGLFYTVYHNAEVPGNGLDIPGAERSYTTYRRMPCTSCSRRSTCSTAGIGRGVCRRIERRARVVWPTVSSNRLQARHVADGADLHHGSLLCVRRAGAAMVTAVRRRHPTGGMSSAKAIDQISLGQVKSSFSTSVCR